MADVYEIAVKLTMLDAVGPGLALLSNKFLGVEKSVSNLIKKFDELSRVQKTAIAGGIAFAGGAAALDLMDKLADKGNKLLKIQQDMAAAGVQQRDIQQAVIKAQEMSAKYRNISEADALESINDQRMIFGSQEIANDHAEIGTRLASFLKAYQGGAHADELGPLMGEITAAIKSGEIAGKMTPEELDQHVRELAAMRLTYGNGLKIADYLKAQRTGGVALRNTSDDFRYGMFPALVQENGVNAGTMLMTAFNKVVAGVGNREQSLQNMVNIGLLSPDQLTQNKQGKFIGIKNMDGLTNSQDAAMNFGNWVMQTLKPKLEGQMDKEGVQGDQQRNIRESQLISSMFPDRNAAKAITEVLQQFTKLSKDAQQMANAFKALDESSYVDQSYDAQKQAMNAQIETFEQNIGQNFVPAFTNMLRAINNSLSSFNQFIEGLDQSKLRQVGALMVGVAAGLTALGAVAVGGALLAAIGPAGWLIVGLAALSATLATNWFAQKGEPVDKGARDDPKASPLQQLKSIFDYLDSIGPKIDDKKINAWLNALFVEAGQEIQTQMADVARKMSAAIQAIPGQVAAAISSMASEIGAKISSALSSINPFGPVSGATAKSAIENLNKLNPSGAKSGLGTRASGGPAYHGSSYLVGEQGPELFTPSNSGFITPNHQMGFNAPPKGGTTEHHTHVYIDGKPVAHHVEQHLVAKMRFPTTAPHFDGMASWASPDMQFSTG